MSISEIKEWQVECDWKNNTQVVPSGFHQESGGQKKQKGVQTCPHGEKGEPAVVAIRLTEGSGITNNLPDGWKYADNMILCPKCSKHYGL